MCTSHRFPVDGYRWAGNFLPGCSTYYIIIAVECTRRWSLLFNDNNNILCTHAPTLVEVWHSKPLSAAP